MIEFDVEEQEKIDSSITNNAKGHVMTLGEMEELQVQACDILCMTPYPLNRNSLLNMLDTTNDTQQRMVYFIPGREAKYVKVPE